MRKRFSAIGLILFMAGSILTACKFNPDIQGPGDPAFQGIWQEEPPEFRDSLLQYTSHRFKFTCDSFYVTLTTNSKVNYYADSCFKNGRWEEYAKGNYVVNNDTLYLIGTFTHSNSKQKLSGCYRTGQYLPAFRVKSTHPDKIELIGLNQHVPVTLKLEQKITCNPQPL